jgi:hypothetical protein
MELFDSIISDTLKQLHPFVTHSWSYDPADAWPDTGKSELVLQRDMAYELGGEGCPGVQYCCVTTGSALDSESEIILCGPDLPEIAGNSAYARIALVRVSALEGTDDDQYRQLCEAAFVKYRVFPKGYMLRISPEHNREQVRLSRQAIAEKISFRRVGADFIRAYQTLPNLVSVKLLFVTDPAVDYEALASAAAGVQARLNALNTILSGLSTDCASCQMKPLCDEVEGMRELHLQHAKNT